MCCRCSLRARENSATRPMAFLLGVQCLLRFRVSKSLCGTRATSCSDFSLSKGSGCCQTLELAREQKCDWQGPSKVNRLRLIPPLTYLSSGILQSVHVSMYRLERAIPNRWHQRWADRKWPKQPVLIRSSSKTTVRIYNWYLFRVAKCAMPGSLK